MNRSINFWQFIGFIIVSILGTISHYLYDWTGNDVIAAISGVNESTWEHMKLLFFPQLIFALIENKVLNKRDDFWCIKLRGTVVGLVLIPMIFYLYNGIIGKSPDWFNISIFFISAAIVFVYEAKMFESGKIKCSFPKRAIFIFVMIALLFIVFTYFTPKFNIFRDPIDGTYGLYKQNRIF